MPGNRGSNGRPSNEYREAAKSLLPECVVKQAQQLRRGAPLIVTCPKCKKEHEVDTGMALTPFELAAVTAQLYQLSGESKEVKIEIIGEEIIRNFVQALETYAAPCATAEDFKERCMAIGMRAAQAMGEVLTAEQEGDCARVLGSE
jgi:hypothetical protein